MAGQARLNPRKPIPVPRAAHYERPPEWATGSKPQGRPRIVDDTTVQETLRELRAEYGRSLFVSELVQALMAGVSCRRRTAYRAIRVPSTVGTSAQPRPRRIAARVVAQQCGPLVTADFNIRKNRHRKQLKYRYLCVSRNDRTSPYLTWKFVKCGKTPCRCNSGTRHGPYPYLRWEDWSVTPGPTVRKGIRAKTRSE